MKLQPRQELLRIWAATARASLQDGKWMGGCRDPSNSISDAEQLLCILYPAMQLDSFQLASPDRTAEDVLDALRTLGGAVDIPKMLVRAITDYMEKYTDDAGSPVFSGEGYFEHKPGVESSLRQRRLDVVDSFSMSITLTLNTLGFIKQFRSAITREELRQEVDRLEKLSSTRLTAAMVGLLRSFSVRVFDVHSASGVLLCDRSNQRNLPKRRIIEELQRELGYIKSRLQDLTMGSGQATDLDNPGRLFECGWSWGIIKDAALIEDVPEKISQQAGVAVDEPYLYFTVIALDGLEDLFSERTRGLNILDDQQRRLLQALNIRWDLAQRYWSTIATFGRDRWPLEDLPWRTSDQQESDYFSLLVSSMVVQNLVQTRSPDAEFDRVNRLLIDLANRGRVNRRPVDNDTALELHVPGVTLELRGSEEAGDHRINWLVTNFAPLLLKRTFQIVLLMDDTKLRGDLLNLANDVWQHLDERRLSDGPGQDLWDQPGGAFEQLSTRYELHSWYYTERVVECLVAAATVIEQARLRSQPLTEVAKDLLDEAEHLFDRELLSGSAEAGPSMRGAVQAARANLQRAREIINYRPGSAVMLANEALRALEQLARAREDVDRGA